MNTKEKFGNTPADILGNQNGCTAREWAEPFTRGAHQSAGRQASAV